MAPRGVPIFPRQDGIAFGSHWERSTVALIESIHDAPEPDGEPALAQWLQRDAHLHILTIKLKAASEGSSACAKPTGVCMTRATRKAKASFVIALILTP